MSEYESFKLAVDYTWGWFALHSGQRMQLTNFLILSLMLITAAFAAAAGNSRYWISTAVALGGIMISFVFWRLDVRTRELVQICEPALVAIEKKLSDLTKITELDFVQAIERPKDGFSYRTSLRILTLVSSVLFTAALVYSLIRAIQSMP